MATVNNKIATYDTLLYYVKAIATQCGKTYSKLTNSIEDISVVRKIPDGVDQTPPDGTTDIPAYLKSLEKLLFIVTFGDGTTKEVDASLLANISDQLDEFAQNTTALANYFTKTEINNLADSLSHLSYKVVTILPTGGDADPIDSSIIYLVKKDPDRNIYSQHVYNGTEWINLGLTTADLSDYYKKTDFENKEVLDKFSESEEGTLLYDGAEIKGGGGAELTEDVTVTGAAVGALKVGDKVEEGTDFTAFVKKLLTTIIPATYRQPAVSLSISPNDLQELGTTVTYTITPTFTKNDAGALESYTIKRGNDVIYTGGATVAAYTDEDVEVSGDIKYTFTATYKQGDIKNNNIGEPSPVGRIEAGSKSTDKTSKAVHGSYYGVVSAEAPTAAEVLALTKIIKDNKAYTYTGITMNDERICYAYPVSFGALTSIKDANNFEYINSYNKETVAINGVNYYVYTLKDKATASGAKMIFA